MKKYIVTHQSGKHSFSNAIIIADHYNRSLSAYSELTEEMRKTFPWLADKDIECLVVTESRRCLHQTVVKALINEPKAEGWRSIEGHLNDIRLG